MASWMIALLFAVGGSAWVYSKLMQTTGNNTSSSLAASALAFVFMFIVTWSVLSIFV